MSKTIIKTELRAVGNAVGIILPSGVLEKLALEESDKVFLLETKKGSFEITPFSREVKETMEVAEGIVKRYRNAFEELTE